MSDDKFYIYLTFKNEEISELGISHRFTSQFYEKNFDYIKDKITSNELLELLFSIKAKKFKENFKWILFTFNNFELFKDIKDPKEIKKMFKLTPSESEAFDKIFFGIENYSFYKRETIANKNIENKSFEKERWKIIRIQQSLMQAISIKFKKLKIGEEIFDNLDTEFILNPLDNKTFDENFTKNEAIKKNKDNKDFLYNCIIVNLSDKIRENRFQSSEDLDLSSIQNVLEDASPNRTEITNLVNTCINLKPFDSALLIKHLLSIFLSGRIESLSRFYSFKYLFSDTKIINKLLSFVSRKVPLIFN